MEALPLCIFAIKGLPISSDERICPFFSFRIGGFAASWSISHNIANIEALVLKAPDPIPKKGVWEPYQLNKKSYLSTKKRVKIILWYCPWGCQKKGCRRWKGLPHRPTPNPAHQHRTDEHRDWTGLPLTFKFWKSRLPGCQFWKSRKKNLEVWYFEGWQMDDHTMYMCMEIIALINLLQGKIAPRPLPPPPKKKKKKKKRYTCSFFSKCILDITIFGHRKCSDTLFFLNRYLFNMYPILPDTFLTGYFCCP